MQDKLEKLIRIVYKKWRQAHLKKVQATPEQSSPDEVHPDEETLVCFLEGRLAQEENAQIKAHLISCDLCGEAIAVQARLKISEEKQVPLELMERVKNLLKAQDKSPVLEIILLLKEKALEILNTTGDILVGQELIPAPVLRSRKIKDFKDEVTVLKDFKDIRVEIKIENKRGEEFNAIVVVREKESAQVIKDLRVTLLKADVELESYLTDVGRVTFEHVVLGKYSVQISNPEDKLASILLDVRK